MTTPPSFQGLPYLPETPSQTAGPFLHIGLLPRRVGVEAFDAEFSHVLVTPETLGTRIRIEGRVLDGLGSPCRDVLVELWQANAAGRYASPADGQASPLDPAFRGFGRGGTDLATGLYAFETVKPGPVAGRRGHRNMAPHVNLWLAARGINLGLATRMYFPDEEAANADDPVLNIVEPAMRRDTLIARREDRDGTPVYLFDIRLQGENETVFFDV